MRVPVRSKDELGELAESFNRMAEDLALHQLELVRRESLRKELELCRRIQNEFLPRTSLRTPTVEVLPLQLLRMLCKPFLRHLFRLGNLMAIHFLGKLVAAFPHIAIPNP